MLLLSDLYRKFELQNLKSKYENELSERYIISIVAFNLIRDLRLSQALRSVDHEVHERTKELTIQLATFNKLEHDV